jgi:hypothetical protein
MFRLPLEYYLYRFGQRTAQFLFWLLTCIGIRLPSVRPLDAIRTSGRHRSEMRELLMLQKRLLSYSGQSMEICKNLCERALGDGRDYPNQGVFAQSALLLFMGILKDEGYFQIPDFDPKQNLSTTETWRLAAIYRRQLALIENPDIANSVEDILRDFGSSPSFRPSLSPCTIS